MYKTPRIKKCEGCEAKFSALSHTHKLCDKCWDKSHSIQFRNGKSNYKKNSFTSRLSRLRRNGIKVDSSILNEIKPIKSIDYEFPEYPLGISLPYGKSLKQKHLNTRNTR